MTDVLILASICLAACLLVLFGWAMVRRSRVRVTHRRVFAVAIRAGLLRRLAAAPALAVDAARYPAPDFPEEPEFTNAMAALRAAAEGGTVRFDLRRPGDVMVGTGIDMAPGCRNCRGTLRWCDDNGCGSRRREHWRSLGDPEVPELQED